MHTIVERLKAAFPFLGERAATEDDLLQFCESEAVPVGFASEVERGVYAIAVDDGEVVGHAIGINPGLAGWSLCYVLAHEIGHYLFHVPGGRSESVAFCKDHKEAETVAALLLLPVPELEAALVAGTFKENDDLAALIAVRLEAWNQYGE